MKRSDFHYELPPELIAQEARPRGRSRMLVLAPRPGDPEIRHTTFEELPSLLSAGDVLVINDTRVFPARLFAEPLGSMTRRIEVLLTKRVGVLRWRCLCKPGRRVRAGERLVFSESLAARVLRRNDDGTFDLQFEGTRGGEEPSNEIPRYAPDDGIGPPSSNLEHPETRGTEDPRHRGTEDLFWSEVERIGSAPVPPYIRADRSREELIEEYQTVYAARRGAVAAPTAGLHFTDEILDSIAGKGVEIVRITLHVGLGTFRPVEVDDIRDHRMDFEAYEIPEESAVTINEALRDGRRIVAVGTTSVRTLEGAIRAGDGKIGPGTGETDLFITPGFDFQVVDALLTNFHLPESTLLMLVSAFAGMESIRKAYREAIDRRYLFYSFGDCMFIQSRIEN